MTDADMIEAIGIAIDNAFGDILPPSRIHRMATAALAVVQPELDRLRAENEALRRERVTVLEKALGEIESQALAAPLARDDFELIDMLQNVYGISSRARAALSAPARDEEGR